MKWKSSCNVSLNRGNSGLFKNIVRSPYEPAVLVCQRIHQHCANFSYMSRASMKTKIGTISKFICLCSKV